MTRHAPHLAERLRAVLGSAPQQDPPPGRRVALDEASLHASAQPGEQFAQRLRQALSA